ncbi:hypothetical protein [Xanthobacter variabilis]|uniref:hypothetical protein n=1 Tax=Xanthobacter variabilis TaxID=3119932 RepID=UPI003726C4B7
MNDLSERLRVAVLDVLSRHHLFPMKPDLFAADLKRALQSACAAGPSSALPPSHVSVLRIIVAEIRRHGACTLSASEIGRRADCSASTVRRAIAAMRAPGMLEVTPRLSSEEGALPNRICITSGAFMSWVDRA